MTNVMSEGWGAALAKEDESGLRWPHKLHYFVNGKSRCGRWSPAGGSRMKPSPAHEELLMMGPCKRCLSMSHKEESPDDRN